MNAEQQKIPIFTKQSSQQPLSFAETNQGDNVPSFLLKTYQILQNPKYHDIISWTRNGEGFIVKKIKEFSDTVLPIYFRHNNYTSFVRQLNMYDFHKTRQENQQNAFKNFLFKKGHKYLLKQIQRKDYKKNKETNKQLYSIIEKQKPQNQNQNIQAFSYSKLKDEGANSLPKNQCFRQNIIELKKIRNQLQEKSLKLMTFRENQFDEDMIMKAIDSLFECGLASKKAFYQIQILKTDFQLNERKRFVEKMREKPIQNEKRPQVYTAEKIIQTKNSLSGFKQSLTDTKTNIFSSSQPKQSVSGFERLQPTQICLFNSFNKIS